MENKKLENIKKDFINYIKRILSKKNVSEYNETLWEYYIASKKRETSSQNNFSSDLEGYTTEEYIKILMSILEYVLENKKTGIKPYLQKIIVAIPTQNLTEKESKVLASLLEKAVLLDTLELYFQDFKASCLRKFEELWQVINQDFAQALFAKAYKKISVLKQTPEMAQFYAEYGYIIYKSCYNAKELNPLAVELCQKSLELNPECSAAYLYLGYMYNFYPRHFYTDINESYKKAEYYFEKAEQYRSKVAGLYLKSIQEKLIPENWIDLMNADENLSELTEILKKNNIKSFSMLLSGPYGGGQQEFARGLLNNLNIKFEEFSLADYSLSGEDNIYIKLQNIQKEKKAYIIKYTEAIFEKLKNHSNLLPEKMSYTLQKILKNNQYPIIFIVDDINRLDVNVRTSFMFRITFNYLDGPQKNVAYKLFFSDDAPHQLDKINGLVLEDFARVKRKAKVLGCLDNPEEIFKLLEDEVKYKFGGKMYNSAVATFSDELINSDVNLNDLTMKLMRSGRGKFTMLIYGPPGTGKSYYLRYLAEKLGISTLEKTATDLFSKYQGEPARNVAQMFEEAKERKAMIILDEVDEILQRRTEIDSVHSWKTDMVNAFLTKLDQAQYPVVCTTNFIEKIDPAILRRFIFKIKFDYLTTEQNRNAFKHFFKKDAPEELDNINNLTNGDYATVKSQSLLLDYADNTQELLKALRQEAIAKTAGSNLYDEDIKNFNKDIINTNMDILKKIETQLSYEDNRNLTLMISGPVGSGKLLYAQYLAKLMNMNFVVYADKDFIEKGNFNYEKIEEIFTKAEDTKSVIIFNDVRYFNGKDENNNSLQQILGNLSAANMRMDSEIFERIKNYPYPVIFIVQNAKRISQIDSFRHIINFTIHFDWLNAKQIRYLYYKTFWYKLPWNYHASAMKHLTPLFFKNVAAMVNLLGISDNPRAIYRIFKEESDKNETIYIQRKLSQILLIILGLCGLVYTIRFLFLR